MSGLVASGCYFSAGPSRAFVVSVSDSPAFGWQARLCKLKSGSVAFQTRASRCQSKIAAKFHWTKLVSSLAPCYPPSADFERLLLTSARSDALNLAFLFLECRTFLWIVRIQPFCACTLWLVTQSLQGADSHSRLTRVVCCSERWVDIPTKWLP